MISLDPTTHVIIAKSDPAPATTHVIIAKSDPAPATTHAIITQSVPAPVQNFRLFILIIYNTRMCFNCNLKLDYMFYYLTIFMMLSSRVCLCLS